MLKIKIKIYFGILLLITVLSASTISDNEKKIKTLSGKYIDKEVVDDFIKKQMDLFNIKGISVAIINDGQIVYYKVQGVKDITTNAKVDYETTFEAASLSKPVFAWFVMKQVEKGLLDLDTPLFEYLPYPDAEHDERYKLITARIVLNHTSGFPNWRWNNWNKDTKEFNLQINFNPGSVFNYSGEGYLYLSKVIAHLNGLNLSNLDSLFQEEVAKPLGLKIAFFQQNRIKKENIANGHSADSLIYPEYEINKNEFSGAGGLNSEAKSFANFLIAIMNNNGLKTENYNEMLKESVKLKSDNELKKYLEVDSWSLGFAITYIKNGIFHSHAGNNVGFTAQFVFNQEAKFGYVFFTNGDRLLDLYKKFNELLIYNKK